jgi:hypothetical protein
MSYELRPYDVEQPELPPKKTQPSEESPGTDFPTLNSDEYFPQTNNQVDSILESPSRKRKFLEAVDESQDPPSPQHVAIKRKIKITKSTPLPTTGKQDVKRGGNQLENTQDHVFKMEYETVDNKKQLPEKPRTRNELKHTRDTELEIPSDDPPRNYRVNQDIQLSPVEKPESSRPLKSWKSEPILNEDLPEDKPKTLKQTSVAIELQKPQIRPLVPAYSIEKLPFETVIRNEVNIKLKKKRRKSYPPAKILDEPAPREIQPHEIVEIPTEEIETKEETVETSSADHSDVEPEGNLDYNEENEEPEYEEPEYEEPVEREQSPPKRDNVSTIQLLYAFSV